jgi:hypothetical protein
MTTASSISIHRLSHVWDREADEHDRDCGANAVMPYRRTRLHAVPAAPQTRQSSPSWPDRLFRTGRA